MRTIYFKATGLNQFRDNTLELDFRLDKRVRSDIEIDELEYISDGIYLANTIPFVGKNASGKTTTLNWYFQLANLLSNNAVQTIQGIFYTGRVSVIYVDNAGDEINLYKTCIELVGKATGGSSVVTEKIYKRRLLKTDSKKSIVNFKEEDIVYNSAANQYFDINSVYTNSYLAKQGTAFSVLYAPLYTANLSLQEQFISLFDFQRQLGVDTTTQLSAILQLLDEGIEYLKYDQETNKYLFKRLKNIEIPVTIEYLASILSAGTLRATCIYYYAFIALQGNTQLIIDEIDLNIHNALAVELINMFQDSRVNQNGSTLVFTTHNLDLLNCFSRNDVIHIISNKDGIHNYLLSHVVERNDNNLSKAKQYLQNVVDSSPSYELKMKMRKQFVK